MTSRNILIIGDSYSTFDGYIPEGFAPYYKRVTERRTDVTDVADTWWHKLISETGSRLAQNNSWSGSTICHTGYGGTDTSGTSSFLHRLDVLCEKGFFNAEKVDTVLIFGGTNDSWANSPIGALNFGEPSREELFSVLPAVCRLMARLRELLPEAELLWLVNTGLKSEIRDGMISAAEHYGVKHVEFDEIDKIDGHPTVLGMEQIKESVKAALGNG